MILLSSKTICPPPLLSHSSHLPFRASRTSTILENVNIEPRLSPAKRRHLCHTFSVDHRTCSLALSLHHNWRRRNDYFSARGHLLDLFFEPSPPFRCKPSSFFLYWHESSHCVLEYFVFLFFCLFVVLSINARVLFG